MTTPLTPDTLVYGFAAASDPQVSPDGARIATGVQRYTSVDCVTAKPVISIPVQSNATAALPPPGATANPITMTK